MAGNSLCVIVFDIYVSRLHNECMTNTKPLASLLTSREYARVAKLTSARIGHDANRSKADYLAELWTTARDTYPGKVA